MLRASGSPASSCLDRCWLSVICIRGSKSTTGFMAGSALRVIASSLQNCLPGLTAGTTRLYLKNDLFGQISSWIFSQSS